MKRGYLLTSIFLLSYAMGVAQFDIFKLPCICGELSVASGPSEVKFTDIPSEGSALLPQLPLSGIRTSFSARLHSDSRLFYGLSYDQFHSTEFLWRGSSKHYGGHLRSEMVTPSIGARIGDRNSLFRLLIEAGIGVNKSRVNLYAENHQTVFKTLDLGQRYSSTLLFRLQDNLTVGLQLSRQLIKMRGKAHLHHHWEDGTVFPISAISSQWSYMLSFSRLLSLK